MKYQVFVRNLETYEEVNLVLPMEEEELEQAMEKLNSGGLHDCIITDAWDDDGENYWKYSEWGNVFKVNELLLAIDNCDDIDAVNAYVEAQGAFDDVDDYYSVDWNDVYLYKDMDIVDVAYEIVEDCYFDRNTPEILKRYFDYDAFASDLMYDGFYETSYGVLEVR